MIRHLLSTRCVGATALAALLSIACSSTDQGNDSHTGAGSAAGSAGTGGASSNGGSGGGIAGNATGGVSGTGGSLSGAGGTTAGTGGSGADEAFDDEQDYARFMQAIALPLVSVLDELEDSTSPDDPAACPTGGTAAIDRTLGEVKFTSCGLGGMTVSGTSVVSQGSSAPPDKSALLLGALLTVSGDETGMVQLQLAELTWQEPPTEAGTKWTASFQTEKSGAICVQSSGEPCP